MKIAKLKLVETPKNTELLDNVIQVYNQTLNRLGDTKNSVKVFRTVTPKEENFQKVKTALNAMLDVNMKKQRGSLNLIETAQEVILVPENNEESAKVQVLVDALSPALSSNLNIRNLDRVALDKVFSNLSWVQTNEFSDEVEVSSTDMNFMNTFVTSSSLMNLTSGWTGHPRAFTVINDAYENLFRVNCLEVGYGFPLREGDYFKVLGKLNRDFDCDQDPNALSDEDSAELRARVTSALNEMKVVNEKLDAYISEVSIPASEFFALLPDEINTELNELVEIAKQKELRDSQLVRKTVNVGLTLNLEVELDSLGDIEDIKNIISKQVEEQLVRNREWFGLHAYRSTKEDYLDVKETTLAGVDVISNLDEVA
jgi:hypothetical protein